MVDAGCEHPGRDPGVSRKANPVLSFGPSSRQTFSFSDRTMPSLVYVLLPYTGGLELEQARRFASDF